MAKRKTKTRNESKQETREALLRAGIEAFSVQGVDVPSLDAICAKAGYTRGAFYVHFRDRDDFLLATIDKLLVDFINQVIASGEYGEDLVKTVDLFINIAEKRRLLALVGGSVRLRVLLEAGGRSPEVKERLAALLQEANSRLQTSTREAQAAGTLRDDLNTAHVASLMIASAVGMIVLTEAGVKLSVRGMRETVHRLFLTPETGRVTRKTKRKGSKKN